MKNMLGSSFTSHHLIDDMTTWEPMLWAGTQNPTHFFRKQT
ncbi:hypothetical protein SAMN04488028_101293 [Reichenbachiella agariperforans]|uniref:Uncharacterized protein n=1 Tax=Reichenbachiella agariperforans TaxID=156994 RepID=A0A1M6JRH6_REIAG|nr:hypothetical protein SAMN04488028_101293 [Reichenbachiella agariperforans]